MTTLKEKIAALEQELETEPDEAKKEKIETKLEGLNNDLDKKLSKEHVSKEHIKKSDEPAWVGRLEAKIEKLLDPPVTTAPEIIPTPPAPTTPEPPQGPKKYTLKDILDQIW